MTGELNSGQGAAGRGAGRWSGVTRREFVSRTMQGGVGAFAVQLALGAGDRTAAASSVSPRPAFTPAPDEPVGPNEIPRRAFGQTGEKVGVLGVGGAHLGLAKSKEEAIGIVHEAIDAGINFMDNAWEYNEGRSEEWMGAALEGGWRDKVFLMTKVCTHGRDAKVAMKQLEESLRRLKTDHLDLWQIHEVVYWNDPELHFAPGGAAEALLKAREQGKVRFVGFTGHKHPDIHLEMLRYDFPFDACQLPLNCFDATFQSFEKMVVPELNRRGIAPIGMKSLGGTADMVKKGAVTAEEAMRYAMSLPVAVTVSGIDSPDVLRKNLKVARGFSRMSPEEMEALRRKVAPLAADGRFELYKSSKNFDAGIGREQHGFPTPQEVGL